MPTVSTITEPTPTRAATGAGLFPLPLSTTEGSFLRQSGITSTPFVFRVRMRLDGSFDETLARDAFEVATQRHPLLRASVAEHAGQPTWVPAGESPLLTFQNEPSDVVRPIDLTASSGLRATVATTGDQTGGGQTIVDVDFHHACCDGQGTRRWLADWMLTYDAFFHGRQPSLEPLREASLFERGRTDSPPWVKPIEPNEGLHNLWLTLRGRTLRVPTKRGQQAGETFAESLLTQEQTLRLRAALQRADVRLNDLGVTSVMTVLAARYGRRRRWLTVMNPVDLRTPSDGRMPAANRLGFAFLRRRPRECASLETLLPSVQEQTRYVKDGYIGMEFIRGLEIVRDRPRLEAVIRRLGWFIPTALFTCLGDTTRGKRLSTTRRDGQFVFGASALQSVSGFAPLGYRTPMAFCCCETADTLNLTLRAHTAAVDQATASELLAAVRDQFDQFADVVLSGNDLVGGESS